MNRCWLLLLPLLCLGCGTDSRTPVTAEPPPPIDSDFSRLPQVIAGIQKSATVTIYEGLPGDFWEPELREQELKKKRTLWKHGYPVYAESPELSTTDAASLTDLMSTGNSYERFASGKKCGGFQLEYSVEWTTDAGTTGALLCLECGEVKIYAPQGELHCDISGPAASQLAGLLERCRKNRPTSP